MSKTDVSTWPTERATYDGETHPAGTGQGSGLKDAGRVTADPTPLPPPICAETGARISEQ